MDCFDDNIAVELFEGTLSPADEREVEQHAATCSSCRRLLAELARSPSLAGAAPTIPAAGDAHIDLNQGDKVGRFSILGRIGHGGMGVVFSAYDPKLDRKVALKLLRSSDDRAISPEEAQSRLLREAQAIAQQSHPNVISVYDVGTYKSEVYIAMELVEGHTLSRWLRLWHRPWRDIVDKFLEAADALAAAHGSGLVHRDFKPDNVLVGDDERVRVMDFGLARSLFYDLPSSGEVADDFRVSIAGVSELNRTLTRTGAVLGTPRYMAPEQFLGGEADARSDQFSFCVALYEALYRQHPFEGSTAKGLVESPKVAPLPPPAKHDVPPYLHRAILRGLEREPSRRFPSMRALRGAITPPRVQPSRAWIAPLAILGVLVVALSIYVWKKRNDAQRAIELARASELDAESSRAVAESLRAELELNQRARAELVAIREDLVSQLGSQLDAIARVRELERQIIEKDLQIDALTKRAQNLGPAAPRPVTYGPRDSAIRQALAPAMDDIKACFTEWRERQPAKNIAVIVRFTIDPGGLVTDAGMLGSPDKVLRLCVTGIISDVAFPASNGVTVVQYEFDTTPTRFDHSSKVVERRAPAPAGP